jgi:hypothetical protein
MPWDDIQEGAARAELSRVTLRRNVMSGNGTVPAGSTGTIVHVYPGGSAYEVEFASPVHAVATVKADDLAG